jgi:hypothetical protein
MLAASNRLRNCSASFPTASLLISSSGYDWIGLVLALGHFMKRISAVVAIAGSLVTSHDSHSETFQDTPSFSAGGTHTCWSSTDIGQQCKVSGIDFSDCNEAKSALQEEDCCPTAGVCKQWNPPGTPGGPLCLKFGDGGTSTSFVLNYCVPH